MLKRILKTLENFNMVNQNDTIVVGISGGPDSICLAHVLKKIYIKNKLIGVHVNYGLRGKESERDEDFVRNFCKDLDIKLFYKKAKIQNFSEEKGRVFRYCFFDEIAKKFSAKIATAHTLSDNCETVLLNLLRGSSIQGLCGIPPIRGNIIRPLIFITRTEVEKYISDNKLDFVIDSSNYNNIFSRNKIRNDVIPILKEINPNFENAIKKLILNISREEEFLDKIAQEEFENSKVLRSGFGFDAKILKTLSENIKFRVAAKIFKFFSPFKQEEYVHVKKIVEIIDGKIKSTQIPGKVKIVRKYNILSVRSI